MTTLLVATTGGHLEQLDELIDRLPVGEHALWVTHENEQSRALLAQRDVVFVPYVRVRNPGDVARCVPTAHRLWRDRKVDRALSTGSGIALGYLPYLAARGVECHYIESAARVSAPSLTGRILHWLPGIRRYTQHERWAGPRWRYAGSVFDSFVAMAAPVTPKTVLRVVVTVGTAAEFPFDRLIDRLAPLLRPGGELTAATGLPVEVLWQTGCSSTRGVPTGATPFVSADRLAAALHDADIVVSHAGTGSALGALRAGRCPLLAPRSARLGEAGDDHQNQLAAELVRRGLATRCDASAIMVDDLLATLSTAVRRSGHPPRFGT